jgi:hypothetical protein
VNRIRSLGKPAISHSLSSGLKGHAAGIRYGMKVIVKKENSEETRSHKNRVLRQPDPHGPRHSALANRALLRKSRRP